MLPILAWLACFAGGRAIAAPTDGLPDRTSRDAQTEPDSKFDGGPGGGFETIVVTAQRREEPLQRVPVSVIALTGADLERRNATNLADIQKYVPNVTLAPSQNVGDSAANVFIRGIGQEDFVAGAEPGVGLYVDGIYHGRTVGALGDLLDIERIEVLRGPQGTLYGRNAIGGAINIISARPQARSAGSIRLVRGSLGHLEARGTVNAKLDNQLFARFAASRVERDGYIRRLPPPFKPTFYTETNLRPEGSEERLTGRLQLRWLANEALTIDLTADRSRRRGTQGAIHLDAVDPDAPTLISVNRLVQQGLLAGPEITGALVSADLRVSNAGAGNRSAQDIAGLSMTATGRLGEQELRLTAAWRGLQSDITTDLDGTWYPIASSSFDESHEQYSVELQATGSLGNASYTAGLFAFRERAELLPSALGAQTVLYFCNCFYSAANLPVTNFPQRQTRGNSYAAYAQAKVPIAEGLSATAGARYSIDRKHIDGQLARLDPVTFEPTGLIVATGANSGSWKAFTWRAALEYQATSDFLFYVSAARGYKSGGFNVRPNQRVENLGLAEFAPEYARTWEAGVRSQWLRGRLRFNATVFDTHYRDIQLRQQTIIAGVLITLIENASRSRVRGAELEIAAEPFAGATLSLAYGYLDARYLDVGRVDGLTLDSVFQRTPRQSFSASMGYEWMGRHGRLAIHADYTYRSREQFQLLATPWDQPGYGLLGGRITWHAPDNGWSLVLFGKNLADVRYRTAGRGTLLRETGVAQSSVGLPRQIGVEVRLDY